MAQLIADNGVDAISEAPEFSSTCTPDFATLNVQELSVLSPCTGRYSDGSRSSADSNSVVDCAMCDASNQPGNLRTLTKVFVSRFADGATSITATAVSKELNMSVADAHGLLGVLEVLQVIVPRGSAYHWRGSRHLAMHLAQDFKRGISVQHGMALPKVCTALIPHLQEALPFTAESLSDAVWNAQCDYVPELEEAEIQQKRALGVQVRDVLLILAGLGYVRVVARPLSATEYVYEPSAVKHCISPKGQQQSARMRNMRVMFDGPAPVGQDHSTPKRDASNPQFSGAAAKHATLESARCTSALAITPGDRRPAMIDVAESPKRHQEVAWDDDAAHARNEHKRRGKTEYLGPDHVTPSYWGAPSPKVLLHDPGSVDELRGLFENTRLSQVSPFAISQVKRLVSRYEHKKERQQRGKGKANAGV